LPTDKHLKFLSRRNDKCRFRFTAEPTRDAVIGLAALSAERVDRDLGNPRRDDEQLRSGKKERPRDRGRTRCCRSPKQHRATDQCD